MDENKAILLFLNVDYGCRYQTVIVRETDSGIEFYEHLGDNYRAKHKLGFRGVRGALVGSSLYLIRGREFMTSRSIDTNMFFMDTCNPELGWKNFRLPFYSSHAKLVVCGHYIYIFPGDYPFFYKGGDHLHRPRSYLCPEDTPSQPYIYDTLENQGGDIGFPSLPCGLWVLHPGHDPADEASQPLTDEFWQHFFPGFRVCTAWGERGLLVSVLGDEKFYLHDPIHKVWETLGNFDPLPEFPGRLPSKNVFPLPLIRSLSAIFNDKLYCCDLPGLGVSPKLHVYDLNKGRLESSHDLPPSLSLGYYNSPHMLPLAVDQLLFLEYSVEDDPETNVGRGEFIYHRVNVSKDFAQVVKSATSRLPFDFLITEVCNIMLIDPQQLQIEPKYFQPSGNKVDRIEGSNLQLQHQPGAQKSTFQENIVEEGDLNALLMLLRTSKNDVVLRAVSGAIAEFAMNEISRALIVSKGGDCLLAGAAAKTDDPSTQSLISSALANISKNGN